MRIFFLIFLSLLSINIFCQNIFSGRVEGYPERELSICSQFGDESKLLSTIKTDFSGNFKYPMEDKEKGLYRVYLETQDYFDIIYYNENIGILTDLANPQYNMIIIESEENKQYYEYLTKDFEISYKIDILEQFLDIYPEGKFADKAEAELNSEIRNKNENIKKAIKINPDSFAGRYMAYFKEIQVPSKYNDAQKMEYIKSNYWKNFKMSDVELLNSNAYNNVVINYLKLVKKPDENAYYQAARTIMDNVFFEDPDVYAFVLEYLLSGFEIMEMYDTSSKLSHEYGNLCENEGEENSLGLRIRNSTELAIGKKAPDFSYKTILDKDYTLSEMSSDYTLIVFWSSWCEHCNKMLPVLEENKAVFNQYNMEVILISLDTDENDLLKFISDKNITFNVICDLMGWKGKTIVDYAVFATPSMFVVDKNLNIIAKPFNEERLLKELSKFPKK